MSSILDNDKKLDPALWPGLESGTQCPVCGKGRIKTLFGSVICSDPHCEFSAGSLIDFVKHSRKCTTKEAVNHVLQHHPNAGQLLAHAPRETLIDDLVEQTEARRSLFEVVEEMFHYQSTRVGQLGEEFLQKNFVDADKARGRIAIVDAEQLQKLAAALAYCTDGKRQDMPARLNQGSYLVFPYYANPHTVSRVLIYDVNTRRSIQWSVYKGVPSWFGLRVTDYFDPPSVYIERDPLVAESVRQNRVVGEGCTCLSFFPAGDAQTPHYFFREAALLIRPDTDVFDTFAYIKSAVTFAVAPYSPSGSAGIPIQFFTYLADKLVEELAAQKEFTQRTKHFASMLSKDTTALHRAVQSLRSVGLETLADELARSTASVFTATSGDFTISSTDLGYSVHDARDNKRSLVTNFTVSISRTVVFERSEDSYHEINLYLPGECITGWVSNSDFRTVQKLHAALSRIRAECFDFDNPGAAPTIVDFTHSKLLLKIIHSASSLIKCDAGQDFIGWHPTKRDTFTAPGLRVTADRCFEIGFHPHPMKSFIPNFEKVDFSTDTALHDLSDFGLDDILGLVAFNVYAYYHGLSQCACTITGTLDQRDALMTAFSHIGQKDFVMLSPSARNVVTQNDVLNGFTFFGMGYDEKACERTALPVLSYADHSNASIPSGWDPAKLGASMKWIYRNVPQYLLRTNERISVRDSLGSDSVNAKIELGKKVILHASGKPHNEVPVHADACTLFSTT